MDWQAIWLSVRLAVSTTAILLALGLPVAYWLTFSPRRWKFLVEALVALPLVLPPTVLGFYVLLAIGPRSPLGALYAKLTGGMLPFSFQGLLLASVLYSFPFTVQPVAAAFAGVDRKLLEASWCLGVSRVATFRRVIVPLSLPGIATGAILSFAHTLGEFGVVLMVGGNIAGVTRTVSISIYDSVQALDYAAASATSLFLLCVSFTVLALTYALQRRIWAVWPSQLICQCRKRLSKASSWRRTCGIPLDRSPVTVLFGPSGSGKTTLLRMLAGLERPDAGSIVFRERPWFDCARAIHLPPQQRRAGFLFQDYALFPHLTVAENVAYAASPRDRPQTARHLRTGGPCRPQAACAFGRAAAARRPGARTGCRACAVAAGRAALRAGRADPLAHAATNCGGCCSPAACPASW